MRKSGGSLPGIYSKVVIMPQYDDVGGFHEGLAWVENRDEYDIGTFGYIDKSGKLIITDLKAENYEDDYSDSPYTAAVSKAGDFSEGFANAIAGHWTGILDKTGKIKWLGESIGIAGPFKFGLAKASRKNGKYYGFINSNGKFIIEPRFSLYDRVSNLNNGLVRYDVGNNILLPSGDIIIGKGYMDLKGKMVSDLDFKRDITIFDPPAADNVSTDNAQNNEEK